MYLTSVNLEIDAFEDLFVADTGVEVLDAEHDALASVKMYYVKWGALSYRTLALILGDTRIKVMKTGYSKLESLGGGSSLNNTPVATDEPLRSCIW